MNVTKTLKVKSYFSWGEIRAALCFCLIIEPGFDGGDSNAGNPIWNELEALETEYNSCVIQSGSSRLGE